LPPSREVLLEKIRGLDGLLCLLTDRIDGEVMDAAGPGLKVISNHAVGVDNIDLPAATRRGIPVGNTPGILTDATADFAFALLLAAARRVVEGERFVHAGRWKTWGPSLLLGTDVFGATLGIVGYGRIGQRWLGAPAASICASCSTTFFTATDPSLPGISVSSRPSCWR
jgi:glyoxylate reductase